MNNVEGVIVKGVGGAYSVSTPGGIITCTARGVFRNKKVTPLVGDRVLISIQDNAGFLHTIKPRANELARPRVANVDQVVITLAAARPAFNAGLLDRFLLLAEKAGVPAVLCVNKCDLLPGGQIEEMTEPYRMAGYPVIQTSAMDSGGFDALMRVMEGKISVFAGPSGVGKSSLINLVTQSASREVGGLSEKIDRGKHTTRHTELLPVSPSGLVADTPGFTSLDLAPIPTEEIAGLFIEFKPYLKQCRFTDCRHDSEADCAVKAAVGTSIHPARYERYISLMNERRHHGY